MYGATSSNESTQRASEWRWEEKDVVWLQSLPRQPPCAWPKVPSRRHSIFVPQDGSRPWDTVWRYAHRRYCGDCMPECGGIRVEPQLTSGFWIEVSHVYVRGAHNIFDRDAFWMYRAQGSGVWYFTGATLVAADTVDAARALNLTLFDRWAAVHDHGFAGGRRSIGKAALLSKLRRRGFETLILTHHIDSDAVGRHRGRSFYKVEVIGLRAHKRLSCPPDTDHVAWGWHAAEPQCTCTPTPTARNDFCYMGKRVFFPFRHLACNVSSARSVATTVARTTSRRCIPRSFEYHGVRFHVVDCEGQDGAGGLTSKGLTQVGSMRPGLLLKPQLSHERRTVSKSWPTAHTRAREAVQQFPAIRAAECNHTLCAISKVDGLWPTEGGCPSNP